MATNQAEILKGVWGGGRPQPLPAKIAVLIPCYNEELTIGTVVRQFRAELPEADIYVFDNNSADGTVEEARRAGAFVLHERRQGKGFVVQQMFQRLEADIYVMVDGDGTYAPGDVRRLIEPVLNDEADMVVGSRLHDGSQSEFRMLNRWGNQLFLGLLNAIFKAQLTDILSGYRAFNRRFVKGVPLLAGGFEIETELTIRALAKGFRIREVPTNLTARPAGSFSKIRHVHDGLLISKTILALARDYKPLTFFGAAGLALAGSGLLVGLLVVVEFLRTGLVTHLPAAVLSVGLVISGLLLIVAGLIVHTILRRFQEFDSRLQELVEELHGPTKLNQVRRNP
jgi:glycosyltransferase involved in cell wall biosynthesis